jgi:hypothetical protein
VQAKARHGSSQAPSRSAQWTSLFGLKLGIDGGVETG